GRASTLERHSPSSFNDGPQEIDALQERNRDDPAGAAPAPDPVVHDDEIRGRAVGDPSAIADERTPKDDEIEAGGPFGRIPRVHELDAARIEQAAGAVEIRLGGLDGCGSTAAAQPPHHEL